MGKMKDQVLSALDDDRDVFELYVKNGNKEFVRHVRFLQSDSLDDAEDLVCEARPDYWKTMSVRSVDIDYVWDVYEDLHFSYNICKSMLGIVEL
jgi:hypothetical protein